jgi:hypothetical protein
LADGGAALVESVRDERGPKGFRFCGDDEDDDDELLPFASPEWCISFLNALRENTYVERLDLSNMHDNDGIPQALASALRENQGLTHLGLRDCRLDDDCLSELMGAITVHPSLRSLAFEWIHVEHEGPSPSEEKRDRTEALADMLSANQQVEEIPFDDRTFDQTLWDSHIAPALECNLYRKRFVPLQKIGEPSTRAAVVARVLAHVTRNPSLVWMLLSQNHNVLFSYLDEAFFLRDT